LQRAVQILKAEGSPNDYAEALLRKAELSLTSGRLEEARYLIEEGCQQALDVSADEGIFRARVLWARFLARSGDPAAACLKLSAYLEEAQSEDHKAEIHFWLWKYSSALDSRQEALRLFASLLERIPRAVYKERTADLRQDL
jgi:hypothetical protein